MTIKKDRHKQGTTTNTEREILYMSPLKVVGLKLKKAEP